MGLFLKPKTVQEQRDSQDRPKVKCDCNHRQLTGSCNANVILIMPIIKTYFVIFFFSHAAHLHQKVLTSAQDNQSLPKSKIPLTTNEQFESELPSITKKTLEGIRDDPIHNLSSSTSGGQMVKIAKNLLSVNLSALHAVLLTHLMAIITVSPSGQINIANILQRIGQMRYDTTFVSAMRQTLTTLLPSEISVRFLNLFLQRFISEFIKAYFARQNELLEKIVVANVDILTDNDKQVLFYICGYLIHALRKQYFRLKSVKARRLLECIDCLQLGNDVVNNLSSKWLDALDRGGLKRPCMKFFNLIVQVEKWVRDVVSVKQLKSDSLVNLKAKLLDYNLLKLSWQNITSGHSECSMVVLEHVLSLFLKVRGFAITKLYRKTLQKNVKPKKTKTDKSNKSLRNGLKSLNNLNSV